MSKRKTKKKKRNRKGGGKGRNRKLGKPNPNRKQTVKKKKRTIRFSECQRDPDCEGTKVCRGNICVEEHQVPKNTRTNSERWELRHGSNLSKQMNRQSSSRERRHRFNIKSRVESKMFEEDRRRKEQGKPPLTEEKKTKYRQMAGEAIERDLDRMREENYRNIQRSEAQRRRRNELAARGRSMVARAAQSEPAAAAAAAVHERPQLRRTDSISQQIGPAFNHSNSRSWGDIERLLGNSTSNNSTSKSSSSRGGRKTRRKKRRRRKSRKRK